MGALSLADRAVRAIVGVLICLVLFPITVSAQTSETAEEIINRVDRLLRGDSSHGVARMEVVTENWERGLTMEIWSLGLDYSLVRVQAPAREAGDTQGY